MAFTGQAKARRCKHCFSLSHLAEDRDWAPTPPTQPTSSAVSASKPNFCSRSSQICYSWNHNPNPNANCVNTGCKYIHTCLYCTRDPQAPEKVASYPGSSPCRKAGRGAWVRGYEKDHKAIYCPSCRLNQTRLQITPPQPGSHSHQQRYCLY